jgi:predicted nucleotidyltransferase
MNTVTLTSAQTEALRPLFETAGTPRFVLIGAAALSVHVSLDRMTNDIDLVFVAPPHVYEPWFEFHGWSRSRTMMHRWVRGGVYVDVLPATDEVIRAREVTFEDGVVMNATGFDLVLAHASQVSIAGTTLSIEVASLASLLVLKLAAWLDRPLEREKDLDDFMQVLRYALSEDADCRWDDTHPVGASELDHDCQSAFHVGLEVGRVADGSHEALVGQFMTAARNEEGPCFGRLALAYRAYDDGLTKTRRALHAFDRGRKGR